MHWTYHAKVERMGGRMRSLTSMQEVESVLSKCESALAQDGQTGVRIKSLQETITVDGSTGNEVWAVVDDAERIVTVMLRHSTQSMNHQWKKQVRITRSRRK